MRSKANTCQKDDDMVKDNRGTVGSVHRLQPVSKPNPWKCFMSGWHLDKKVPLALIGVLLLQTFGIGWWSSDVSARTTQAEKSIAQLQEFQMESVAVLSRLDERTGKLNETLNRLEKKLP